MHNGKFWWVIRPTACQTRPTIVNTNSDETLFYPLTVSVNKYGRICNTIDNPYARVCVLQKVKNMNVKVSNLNKEQMKQELVRQESRKCKCELNKSVWN